MQVNRTSMNVLMQLTGRLIAVVLLTICVWASGQINPALAGPTATSPKTCRVGTYITSLRDLKLAEKSFAADFWLWSVCPSKDLTPLDSAEIVGATSSQTAYNTTSERKDLSGVFPSTKQVYYSQRKDYATFFYDWNVKSYPFDRHVLKIPLEEANLETSEFVYTPDSANSGYQQSMDLGGSWKITGFNITEEKTPYNTTFGDPEITAKQAKYSRLVASISIRRIAIVGFLKLSAGVYAAIALTILSLLVAKDPSSQLGTLIGTLFAALVSLQAAGGELGSKDVVTLIDFIHIVAIFYIFLAAVITVYSQRLHKADKGERVHYLMRRIFCPILAVSFIVINIVVISYAAVVG